MTLFIAGVVVGIIAVVGVGYWLYRKAEHDAFLRFWG